MQEPAGKPGIKGLIVVDLQRAFRPSPQVVEGIRAILPEYDVVIATQFLNRKWSLYETEIGYTKCQIGSPEADIVIPLKPKAVFDRFTYGLQQVHIDYLKQIPVYRWDIVGCDSDACVLATCFDLWDAGIRFNILQHLCESSGGNEVNTAAMAIMARNFRSQKDEAL